MFKWQILKSQMIVQVPNIKKSDDWSTRNIKKLDDCSSSKQRKVRWLFKWQTRLKVFLTSGMREQQAAAGSPEAESIPSQYSLPTYLQYSMNYLISSTRCQHIFNIWWYIWYLVLVAHVSLIFKKIFEYLVLNAHVSLIFKKYLLFSTRCPHIFNIQKIFTI